MAPGRIGGGGERKENMELEGSRRGQIGGVERREHRSAAAHAVQEEFVHV